MPTTAVYARIDSDLKKNAEAILSQLGISPSSAIQMLYSQIVLTNGLPFENRLPSKPILSLDNMTKEDLDRELAKGMKSLEDGKGYTPDEVDAEFKKRFNL